MSFLKLFAQFILFPAIVAYCIIFTIIPFFMAKPVDVPSHSFKNKFEIVTFQLRDSVWDMCYDHRVYNLSSETNYIISVRCELDTNRYHTNVIIK